MTDVLAFVLGQDSFPLSTCHPNVNKQDQMKMMHSNLKRDENYGLGGVAFDHGTFPKIIAIHSMTKAKSMPSLQPEQLPPPLLHSADLMPTDAYAKHNHRESMQQQQRMQQDSFSRQSSVDSSSEMIRAENSLPNKLVDSHPYDRLHREIDADALKINQSLQQRVHARSNTDIAASESKHVSASGGNRSANNSYRQKGTVTAENPFTINYYGPSDPPALLPISINPDSGSKRTTPVGFPFKISNHNHPPTLTRYPVETTHYEPGYTANSPLRLTAAQLQYQQLYGASFLPAQGSRMRFPYDQFPYSKYPPQRMLQPGMLQPGMLQPGMLQPGMLQSMPYDANIHRQRFLFPGNIHHNTFPAKNHRPRPRFEEMIYPVTYDKLGRRQFEHDRQSQDAFMQSQYALQVEHALKMHQRNDRVIREQKPYERRSKSPRDYSSLLKLENRYDFAYVLKCAADEGWEKLHYTITRLLENNIIQNSLCLLENLKSSDLTERTKEQILSVTEEIIWQAPARHELWLKNQSKTAEMNGYDDNESRQQHNNMRDVTQQQHNSMRDVAQQQQQHHDMRDVTQQKHSSIRDVVQQQQQHDIMRDVAQQQQHDIMRDVAQQQHHDIMRDVTQQKHSSIRDVVQQQQQQHDIMRDVVQQHHDIMRDVAHQQQQQHNSSHMHDLTHRQQQQYLEQQGVRLQENNFPNVAWKITSDHPMSRAAEPNTWPNAAEGYDACDGIRGKGMDTAMPMVDAQLGKSNESHQNNATDDFHSDLSLRQLLAKSTVTSIANGNNTGISGNSGNTSPAEAQNIDQQDHVMHSEAAATESDTSVRQHSDKCIDDLEPPIADTEGQLKTDNVQCKLSSNDLVEKTVNEKRAESSFDYQKFKMKSFNEIAMNVKLEPLSDEELTRNCYKFRRIEGCKDATGKEIGESKYRDLVNEKYIKKEIEDELVAMKTSIIGNVFDLFAR